MCMYVRGCMDQVCVILLNIEGAAENKKADTRGSRVQIKINEGMLREKIA